MKGRHSIVVSNKRVSYNIELVRKITVIKGNSGTGKTTLVRMLDSWIKQGRTSGIKCTTSAEVIILNEISDWGTLLSSCKGKIFVADEGVRYMSWQSFGNAVNKSENYFLFISRSGSLGNMTYSVNSILQLGSKRKGDMTFNSAYLKYIDNSVSIKPDLIITEDSNSGNEMMHCLLSCDIKSSLGRSNVFKTYMLNEDSYKNIVVFVDGSAFGANISEFSGYFDDVVIVAPESFEYLLLNLDFIKRFVKDEVENTVDYCDYREDIISYERYYTELLKYVLKLRYNKSYDKSKLIEFFKNKNVYNQLKLVLSDIDFS